MKQILSLAFTIMLLFAVSGRAFSQVPDVKQLPDDPRIKKGTLANGLTYYIVKNTAVKGYADFAIAQKVGTSIEQTNQKGMCKMMEFLSTKGTRNFTDSTIVKYLNSIGVDSKNIKFDTGADEIVYAIEGVPVGRQNTMDSTLLILYNWLASINIDEEDIAQTVPVLKNSLMDEWDAQKRIDDKFIKSLYPKSPYANSITIDQINGLKGYSSKELRNFYYKWFRPDLQAVFVVGDLDPAKVETQIKSIFATIPKPLKPEKRVYYTPKMVNGTQVIIGKDPEFDKTAVAIHFMRVPLLDKYKVTSVPYIESYFDDAISTLLLRRISSGIVSQNLPISNVRIERGKFMEMTNMETFSITFETLPSTVYAAISFLSGEINMLARNGFNPQEFANSRERYFRALEHVYDNRLSQSNSKYMERVMGNYLDGYSLASTEMHFEIMKEVLFSLKTSQLNDYARALLGQKEGVVISCSMPDVKGIGELSVERIQDSFVNSLSKSDYADKTGNLVRWPKFVAGDKQATFASQGTDPATGAGIYNLSNGIKVIYKQTENSADTLSFRAVSKGGLSVVRDNYGKEIELYISDIANLSAVGGMSRSDWEKLFAYNNVQLNMRIDDHKEELYGYSGAASVEKLFHLINLYFTQRQSDYSSFDIYKKGKSYEALYRSISPVNVFEDSVTFYNSSNKRFIPTYSREYVEQMDYYKIQNTINGRFANPADFVYVFAGSVSPDVIADYVLKYLGSLSTVTDKEEWFVTPSYPAKGKVERRFLHQMVIPRTYIDVTLSCGMQNNMENDIMGRLLQEYLSGVYANGKIKELSPKSSVSSEIDYYPEEIFICKSRFETDSAGLEQVLNHFNGVMQEMVYGGIGENTLTSLKKSLKEKIGAAMKRNGYWLDVYAGTYLLGKDFHSGYMDAVDAVTAEKLREFVDMVYRRGNMITVVMEGTSHDVNTQKLFRENQFIKEFFDL